MLDFLEAMMILCFGISWPISIYKSWRSRTAKGKSVMFEYFILAGYFFGMTRKAIQIYIGATSGWTFWLALVFYVLNTIEIIIDICLYYRNVRLDKLREASGGAVSDTMM